MHVDWPGAVALGTEPRVHSARQVGHCGVRDPFCHRQVSAARETLIATEAEIAQTFAAEQNGGAAGAASSHACSTYRIDRAAQRIALKLRGERPRAQGAPPPLVRRQSSIRCAARYAQGVSNAEPSNGRDA